MSNLRPFYVIQHARAGWYFNEERDFWETSIKAVPHYYSHERAVAVAYEFCIDGVSVISNWQPREIDSSDGDY